MSRLTDSRKFHNLILTINWSGINIINVRNIFVALSLPLRLLEINRLQLKQHHQSQVEHSSFANLTSCIRERCVLHGANDVTHNNLKFLYAAVTRSDELFNLIVATFARR
eukprot:6060343-Pleurochrysis_carterae.AAC.3